MLSNIVSTAAGVGIGHAIGHSLTGWMGGSSTPAEQGSSAAAAAGTATSENRMGSCDADAKAFTSCMDSYKGDMTACSWYLEQLKVCPFEEVIDCSLVSKWRVSINWTMEWKIKHVNSAFA
jgi:hypothetical protein